jgi:hypothetical protein
MPNPKKHRRTRKLVLKDRSPPKRFPSSIAATVLAIRQYWLQEIERIDKNTPGLSVEDFLNESDFEECYLRVMSLYRGIRNPPLDSPDSQLYDIPKNDTNMDYYKLRTFAKFTEVRPAGIFLLFTQLVGEELRAIDQGRDAKEACIQLLDGVQRIVECTKQHLLDPAKGGAAKRSFWRQYGDTGAEDNLLPNMEMLKLWRDAFLNGPLPPDATSDEDEDVKPKRKQRSR